MWAIEWSDPWAPVKHYADVDSKVSAERLAYGLRATGADHVRVWELSPEPGR